MGELQQCQAEIRRLRSVVRELQDELELLKKTSIISEEKQQWMKEKGFKKLERPMVYSLGTNHEFSEEYIANTPLEELKTKYDEKLIEGAYLADN